MRDFDRTVAPVFNLIAAKNSQRQKFSALQELLLARLAIN